MMKLQRFCFNIRRLLSMDDALLFAEQKRNGWCIPFENNLVRLIVVSLFLLLCGSLIIGIMRRRTKKFLEHYGFPTIYWRPRFMNYRAFEDKQKLSASTITRILPKMKQHGGPYGMFGTVYGITTPVIHVAHPIPAKAVLTGKTIRNTKGTTRRTSVSVEFSSATSKAPAYNHFKNFSGEGVFTADGEDWKAKRTAIMHCLVKGTASSTSEMSKRLEDEANRAASAFCGQIEILQQNNLAVDCDQCGIATTNVVPVLQRSTIGLIYRYLTHSDPLWLLPANMVSNSKNESDREDIAIGNTEGEVSESVSVSSSLDGSDFSGPDNTVCSQASSPSMLNTYLSSILRIRMIILAKSRSLWYLLPEWVYRLFSSLYRDEEATLGPIHDFAKMACDDALPQSPLSKLKESDGPYSDDNSSFFDWNRKSSSNRRINKNLLYEATTILFAGQDTTAATLSWTLHLLSLHPDVQERLAEEVREALKIDEDFVRSGEGTITRKAISKLTYLDAVVKEAMRLYPVAPFVVRRLREDVCIPAENNDGIMSLPTSSVALIWIYTMQRNPAFWDRPDDFVPERWIDVGLKDPGQSNGAYMPFASGPRNCLGQSIAHIVIRTILARLIHRFQFTDPRLKNTAITKDLRIEMEAGFTVLPAGGVNLEVRNRTPKKEKTN